MFSSSASPPTDAPLPAALRNGRLSDVSGELPAHVEKWLDDDTAWQMQSRQLHGTCQLPDLHIFETRPRRLSKTSRPCYRPEAR